jgi:uncharacterized protein (DUF1330 family)
VLCTCDGQFASNEHDAVRQELIGEAMPAYIVSRLTIRDADAMRRYVNEAPATVAAYGGRYHFRGSNVQALEGSWDQDRMVVLEFPSKANALAWYESDIYRPLRLLRQASAEATILLADGDAAAR